MIVPVLRATKRGPRHRVNRVERGDVKRNHRLHLVNVRVQKRRAGGHAGIVDEHGHARVATKHGLDFASAALSPRSAGTTLTDRPALTSVAPRWSPKLIGWLVWGGWGRSDE